MNAVYVPLPLAWGPTNPIYADIYFTSGALGSVEFTPSCPDFLAVSRQLRTPSAVYCYQPVRIDAYIFQDYNH